MFPTECREHVLSLTKCLLHINNVNGDVTCHACLLNNPFPLGSYFFSDLFLLFFCVFIYLLNTICMLFSNNNTNHDPWYIFNGNVMNNNRHRVKQWWSVKNPYIYHSSIGLRLAKYSTFDVINQSEIALVQFRGYH